MLSDLQRKARELANGHEETTGGQPPEVRCIHFFSVHFVNPQSLGGNFCLDVISTNYHAHTHPHTPTHTHIHTHPRTQGPSDQSSGRVHVYAHSERTHRMWEWSRAGKAQVKALSSEWVNINVSKYLFFLL